MAVPLAELRERIPALDGGRISRVEQGWDFEVYVLDETWIARVPRRPEVARQVPVEIALLERLAASLPVAVPQVEAVAPDGAAWFAYRRLEGEPLPVGARPESVAAFLAALHAFPIASALEAGVRAADWRDDMAAQLAEFEKRVLPLLSDDVRRDAERAFRDYLEDDASFAFRPALIHGDLGREHLLCGHDGRLLAVIDWTDARVGDPALDFAWLLNGPGERFATGLLCGYDAETDEPLRRRARFFHRLGPWHEVTYGLDEGLPRYVESGLAGIRERLR